MIPLDTCMQGILDVQVLASFLIGAVVMAAILLMADAIKGAKHDD